MSNGTFSYPSVLLRALVNPAGANDDGRHRGDVTATLLLAVLGGFAFAYQYVAPRVRGDMPLVDWIVASSRNPRSFHVELFGRGLAIAAVVLAGYFLLNFLAGLLVGAPDRQRAVDYLGAAAVAALPLLYGTLLTAALLKVHVLAVLPVLGLLAGAFVHHHAQVFYFGLWRSLSIYLVPALFALQLYAYYRLTP